MPLHMVKLCVGADSVDDLRSWVEARLDEARRDGRPVEQIHQTRMLPKRGEEVLAGGSLFWVIRGNVQVRQRIVALRPITDAEGIRRCQIVLDPVFVSTEWLPRRPFQGWRYLLASEAPADAGEDGGADALPQAIRRELTALGLL